MLNKIVDSSLTSEQVIVILVAIRRIISGTQEPPVKELLETNILDVLCRIFGMEDSSTDIRNMKVSEMSSTQNGSFINLINCMQLESTWIITNLAYGSEQELEAMFGIEYDILSHMNNLLKGSDVQLIEQVLWFFANVSGDSMKFRD